MYKVVYIVWHNVWHLHGFSGGGLQNLFKSLRKQADNWADLASAVTPLHQKLPSVKKLHIFAASLFLTYSCSCSLRSSTEVSEGHGSLSLNIFYLATLAVSLKILLLWSYLFKYLYFLFEFI